MPKAVSAVSTVASKNAQSGVVLIVALVILLVVTLLGVAVMRGATLDLKMANNSQERHQAFNAAEAALAQAEAKLMNLGLTDANLKGSGTNAFSSTCTNGLCFTGAYTSGQSGCSVVPSSGVIAADPWSDTTLAVWTTANRHIALVTSANLSTSPNIANPTGQRLTANYIIEFRCFVDGDGGLVSADQGDVLFRITALGISAAGNSKVMLQSTFRMSHP